MLQVMSYNVLADRLASGSKFSHATSRVLSFDFRAPRIMSEIEQSDAQVVCLQEVDRVPDWYRPRLQALGMKLMHYKRSGFFRGDGIAIAYRNEQMRLLDTVQVDLNDLAKLYSNSIFTSATTKRCLPVRAHKIVEANSGGQPALALQPKE